MCKYICKEDKEPLRDGILVKFAEAGYSFLRSNPKEGKMDCLMRAAMQDNCDILELFEQMPGIDIVFYWFLE